jgi:hypothetical protein
LSARHGLGHISGAATCRSSPMQRNPAPGRARTRVQPPPPWSLLAQHQERDQRRDGREADRNDNDVEPRHAGSSAMPHGLRQGCQHSILALAAAKPRRCAGLPWRGPGAGLWAGPAASATAPPAPKPQRPPSGPESCLSGDTVTAMAPIAGMMLHCGE